MKLILNLFGLAVGILVIEVYWRYWAYKPINQAWDCYQPDLRMYLVYKPNSVCPYRRFGEYDTRPQINNLGLRSDFNTTSKKPGGVKRILILGDSWVAAHEVEERQTFVKLLENKFRDRGEYVEVLNGGIRGYSPFLNYFYLKFKAVDFEPDWVLLVVNSADIADDRRYREYGKINPVSGEIESVFPNWVFYNSRNQATQLAITVVVQPKLQFKLQTVAVVKQNLITWLNRWLGWQFFMTEFKLGDWRTDPLAAERPVMVRDDYASLIGQAEENIGKIAELVESRGGKFLLVTAPMGHEVGAKEWDGGRGGWGVERNRIYPTRALDEIKQWAEGQKISVVNLTPKLREPHEENYFLPKDGHLTVAGHQRVAEILWGELEKGIN